MPSPEPLGLAEQLLGKPHVGGGGMICKQACGSRAGRIWRRVEWPEDAQETEGSQPVDLGSQVLWRMRAPTGSASITGFPPLFQVSSLPF